jgi:hypothetical protein
MQARIRSLQKKLKEFTTLECSKISGDYVTTKDDFPDNNRKKEAHRFEDYLDNRLPTHFTITFLSMSYPK